MRADAIYVVTTPTGHVSDTAAFEREQATHRYVVQWLPEAVRVKASEFLLSCMWQAFEEAGYKAHRIDMPDALEGKPVCRT
jgi:hypothetical protein